MMRPPGPPIPVRTLPSHHGEAPADLPVVELRMTAHDRRRVRRLIEAPDGAVLALELATGTVLHPGQLLHHDAEAAYVISAADEDVLVVHPRDIAEAARIAHMIGNLHRDIHVEGSHITALADATLADRLEKAGAPFERVRRPFHGRAAGEHSH
jgi:urease accessory protein